MKKNSKPTFYEFIKMIYGMTIDEFEELNDYQKKAAEIDYENRYGTIRWF